MSVNDLAQEMEDAARAALFETGALRECERHQVTIRVGNTDAEKHAYAIATSKLKSKDEMFLREELMSTIQNVLDLSADDDECPECARLRDA